MDCRVCGKEFEPELVRGRHLAGIAFGDHMTEDYPRCREKMKAVDWRIHHNKSPTTKLLDKELKKLIKYLTSLLEDRP
jgi:hypothetical protein